MVFKSVTDLFGNVPFSEGLMPDILLPKYDSQADIYIGMIADVKAARDMINTSAGGLNGDVIYYGDMEKWQKFANSFLMSLTMQLSKVYPGAAEFASIEFNNALAHPAGCIETLDQEAIYTYDVQNGYDNPWNWIRSGDYGVSEEFTTSMRGTGTTTSNTTYDNRLDLIARNPSIDGEPYGYLVYGGTPNRLASVIFDAETRLPLLTAAYSWLHRAEAAAKGWTTEDVSTLLTNGIKMSYASMESLYDPDGTKDIGDGSAYAAARVADISTAAGGALQVVCEEKWVALFPLGFDAWAEWRRTEIPSLIPATDAFNNGEIPRRYNYPSTEATLNPDGYAEGVATLDPPTDNNTSRMWWDQ